MTSDEKSFFELLDDYARTHHNCLITEMFVSGTNLEYAICFRPLERSGQRERGPGCKYIYVAIDDVRTIGETKNLSEVLRETLDSQLPSLSAPKPGEHR